MLGNFSVKNPLKLGRDIRIKLKIEQVKTKCGAWELITVIHATSVQKNFWIPTFIKQLLRKYQILKKSPQISDIHKNRTF